MRTSTPIFILAVSMLASAGKLGAEDPAARVLPAGPATKWKKSDFQPAEACKSCHPQHYEEWRGSMHAYAITDPVFHAMHKLAQEETAGEIGDFCIKCHAPVGTGIGEVTGKTRSAEGLSDISLAGVSCETCHRGVNLEKGHPGNARFEIHPGAAVVGGLPNPQATPAHDSVTNDSLKNPDFCGSCHNVSNRRGVKIEKPHDEFIASTYPERNTGCLNCHMQTYTGRATPDGPLRNRLHRHNFIGVDVAVTPFPRMGYQRREIAAFLRTAAKMTVAAPGQAVAGEAFKIDVHVKNVGAGHNLPTGPSTEREMWLEVSATSSDGRTLFESGSLDAGGDLRGGHGGPSTKDPQLALFTDRFVGKKGETVYFMWQAHALEEHTIPPLQTRSASYSFKIPAALQGKKFKLEVRLRFRAFPPHQLRRLGIGNLAERFPVFDLAEYAQPGITVVKSLRKKGTIRVPEDAGTIPAAIRQAVAGDTISVAPGTYTIDKPLNFSGRDISLVSRAGAEKTILTPAPTPAGPQLTALLVFTGGETAAAEIRGFTFEGGRGLLRNSQRVGGAVVCIDSQPTFTGNVFIGNEAAAGGAVYLLRSNATLADNEFRSNRSDSGGAIEISAGSRPLATGNSFTDNRAQRGGAIHIKKAGGVFTGNLFRANRAFKGGAFLLTGGEPAVIALNKNRFIGNTAKTAGALLAEGPCRVSSTRDLFAGNIGGAISLRAGAGAEINHATIVDNRMGKGALETDASSSLAVSHSILWGNRPLELAGEFSWSLVETEALAGGTNLRAPPLFRPPYSEWERCGGPEDLCVPILRPDAESLEPATAGLYRRYKPGILELFADSPAVDAGNPASPVDEDGTRADLGAVAKLKSRRLFIRGDLDGNGMVDVNDAQAIFTLVENKLRIACMESADVDGNGIIGRQDGVRLMNFLMTGQNPPAPPWPVCGPTPKTASPLGCFENRCKP